MAFELSVVINLVHAPEDLEKHMMEMIALFNEQDLSHEFIIICPNQLSSYWGKIKTLPTTYRSASVFLIEHTNGLNGMALCGCMNAKGNYILTLTNEFKHPVSSIIPMLVALKKSNCDIVYARNKRKGSPIRSFIVRLFRVTFAILSGLGAELSHYRIVKASCTRGLKVKTPYYFLFDQLIRPNIKAYTYFYFEQKKKPASLASLFVQTLKWSYYTFAWTYLGEVLIILLLGFNIVLLLHGRLFFALILGAVSMLTLWLVFMSKWRRRIAYRILEKRTS